MTPGCVGTLTCMLTFPPSHLPIPTHTHTHAHKHARTLFYTQTPTPRFAGAAADHGAGGRCSSPAAACWTASSPSALQTSSSSRLPDPACSHDKWAWCKFERAAAAPARLTASPRDWAARARGRA